jgi:hypothetical protein
MAGRFAGVSDLEWRLFEDVFPPVPPTNLVMISATYMGK